MFTMVNHIVFGGHSSKVKVTMGIINKCGVRGALRCYIFGFKTHNLGTENHSAIHHPQK